MNRSKLYLYIAGIVALAIFVTVLVFFGGELAATGEKIGQRDRIIALKESVKNDDYCLYWVGDVPSRLSGLNIKVLDKDEFKESDLPLSHYLGYLYVKETDDKGITRNVKKQKYFDQDCPAHSFIIINNVEDLTVDKRRLFERCIVDSNTVVLVIGKGAVDSYRSYLLKPTGIVFEYWSMIVTFAGGEPPVDVLDPERIKDPDSVDFTLEFLEYLNTKLGH